MTQILSADLGDSQKLKVYLSSYPSRVLFFGVKASRQRKFEICFGCKAEGMFNLIDKHGVVSDEFSSSDIAVLIANLIRSGNEVHLFEDAHKLKAWLNLDEGAESTFWSINSAGYIRVADLPATQIRDIIRDLAFLKAELKLSFDLGDEGIKLLLEANNLKHEYESIASLIDLKSFFLLSPEDGSRFTVKTDSEVALSKLIEMLKSLKAKVEGQPNPEQPQDLALLNSLCIYTINEENLKNLLGFTRETNLGRKDSKRNYYVYTFSRGNGENKQFLGLQRYDNIPFGFYRVAGSFDELSPLLHMVELRLLPIQRDRPEN